MTTSTRRSTRSSRSQKKPPAAETRPASTSSSSKSKKSSKRGTTRGKSSSQSSGKNNNNNSSTTLSKNNHQSIASDTTANNGSSTTQQHSLTYQLYQSILNSTIEEIKDLHIPSLTSQYPSLFKSQHDAERYFDEVVAREWLRVLEEMGVMRQKELTPYEMYLRRLEQERRDSDANGAGVAPQSAASRRAPPHKDSALLPDNVESATAALLDQHTHFQTARPMYRTDRAADLIHKQLNPADYNSIANPKWKKQTSASSSSRAADTAGKPSLGMRTTLELMQFGKPPKYLPSSKKDDMRDPAQRQEERRDDERKKNKDSLESLKQHVKEKNMESIRNTTTTTTQHTDVSSEAEPTAQEEGFTSSLKEKEPKRSKRREQETAPATNNQESTRKRRVTRKRKATNPSTLQVDGPTDDVIMLSDIKNESDSEDDEINQLLQKDPAKASHYLVSQFSYKHKPRTGKHKWKLSLSNAILHIDGKDQLYSGIDAELEW